MRTPRTWFARRAAETDRPAQGAGVRPPNRSFADETGALSLGAVYRSAQILSTAGQQLTLDVWRAGEPVTPTPSVVRRPDIRRSLSEFLALTINSLALTGNAYWRVIRDDRGARNLEVLNPWECSPQEDGTLGWKGIKRLSPDDHQHMRLLPRSGHVLGLGPIQAARADIQNALELRDYSGTIFSTGDVPSGVLSTDQALTAEQAAAWAATWRDRDPRTIAVLGAGLSYSPVLLSPEDAQFLESQQFSTTGIARLFGIPAHMLLAAVEGSSLTYQNMAQADLAFVRWTLMAYLRPIEEAVTAILPNGQTARFNLDAITRPDLTTRYTAHRTALDAGFLTVNEVRAIEGLTALPGGDALRPASTTTTGSTNA